MGAAERPQQVGGQDGRPEFLGQTVEVGRRDRLGRGRRAGIVGEIIETAELFDRLADHRLGLAGLRHVAGRRDHVEARGPKLRDRLRPARVLRQMVERHPGAALRKGFDRRQADAGGAARDQRGLAAEIAHAQSRHARPEWARAALVPLLNPKFARFIGDSLANFGFKSGTSIIELLVSLKIPKFASEVAARMCELRNRDTCLALPSDPKCQRCGAASLNRTPPFILSCFSDSTSVTTTAPGSTLKFFTTASVMSFISPRFWSSERPPRA